MISCPNLNKYDVVSFDIFDTLITRCVATPHGIFHVMRSRLLKTGLDLSHTQIASFVETRALCEREARRESDLEDITLDDIYSKVGNALFLSQAEAARLKRLEIDTELEFITSVPPVLDRFHELAEQDCRLLLITDMYLPREVIQGLLNRVDPSILTKAKLYISSEVGLTKRSGGLYRHVLSAEDISLGDLHHIGDNRVSDYDVPKRMGISAFHYEPTKLRRWEYVGLAHIDAQVRKQQGKAGIFRRRSRTHSIKQVRQAADDVLSWQVTAGLSRKRRFKSHSNTSLAGYSVAGPILVPYVRWLLHQAKEQCISRLYFVARDGQILHALASHLQALGEGTGVELRYLYGSRQAWHLPATREIGEHEITWLFQTRSFSTASNIALRLGVESNRLIQNLVKAGLTGITEDGRLSTSQIARIKEILLSDKQLRGAVYDGARAERVLVQEYLQQEGFFDGTKYAIVDIGWSARSQDSLLSILEPEQRPTEMLGFYFGLVRYTSRVGCENRKYAFAINPEYASINHALLYHLIHFMETFVSADHGSTMGYRRGSTGCIVPVFDNQDKSVRDWGIKEFQAEILEFAGDWLRLEIDTSIESMQRRLQDLYHYLMVEMPDKEIADVMGAFPYTTDQEGKNQGELGPRLTVSQAITYLRLDPPSRRHMCLWPEGSAVRSEGLVRILLHPRTRGFFSLLFRPQSAHLLVGRWLAANFPHETLLRIKRALPPTVARTLERLLFR